MDRKRSTSSKKRDASADVEEEEDRKKSIRQQQPPTPTSSSATTQQQRTVSRQQHSRQASTSSRTTSYGGTLSDLEHDSGSNSGSNSKDRYKKLAKKLSQKLIEIKDESQAVSADLKHKEHELSNVREQLSDLRSAMIEDKEKMRTEYDHKLQKSQESFERYRTGAISSESKAVKRMEGIINMLQEKIAQHEHLKDLSEQTICKREDQMRQTVNELEERFRLYKDQQEQERTQQLSLLKKDKDAEINRVTAERNLLHKTCQDLKETTEKRVRQAEKTRDEQIQVVKNELERKRQEYQSTLDDMKQQWKYITESTKNEHDGRVSQMEKDHKITIDTLTQTHTRDFDRLLADTSHKLDTLRKEADEQTETLLEKNKKLQEELDSINKNIALEIGKREVDLKKQYDDMAKHTQDQCNTTLSRQEDVCVELRKRCDSLTADLKSANDSARVQLDAARESARKVQDNLRDVQQQLTITVNRQKETLDAEISVRERKIVQITQNSERAVAEAMNKWSTADRKLRQTTVDYNSLLEKHSEIKAIQDKRVKELDSELQDRKKDLQRFNERLASYSHAELKLKTELHSIKNTVASTQKELDSKRAELSEKTRLFDNEAARALQFHTIVKDLSQQVKDRDTELLKKERELRLLQTEYEITTRNMNSFREDLTRTKTQIVGEWSDKVRQVTADKDKTISDCKNQIAQISGMYKESDRDRERAVSDIATIAAEREKLKDELAKQTIASRDCKNQIAHISALYKECDRDRERAVSDIAAFSAEREKLKEELAKQTAALRDKPDTAVIQKQLTNAISSLKKEIEAKDRELFVLRSSAKTSDAKDIQIAALSNQLNNIHQTHRQTIDRIVSDSRKEKEVINKDRDQLADLRAKVENSENNTKQMELLKAALLQTKQQSKRQTDEHKRELDSVLSQLRASESLNMQHAQKMEVLKLEFLKQLNETRKLPVADQEKLNLMEKENNDLKIQVSSAETRLKAAQMDLASIAANVTARTKALDDKEKELLREKEIIRDTPPKLLDPSIKKSRDDALAHLRQSRLENAKVKDEVTEMTQKLQIAEGLIRDLEKERVHILQSKAELRETFVGTLNDQRASHEKETVQMSKRVRELEKMLFEFHRNTTPVAAPTQPQTANT